MRKCRKEDCKKELPSKANSDAWQSNGFCNIDCMADHGMAKAMQQKARKRKADEAGIKKRNQAFKRKVQLGDTTSQEELTQKAFNKVIKLEELYRCALAGEQPVCISCSKPWTPYDNRDFAAGHYFSRGARSDLAMNNMNVFLQCNQKCNCKLSANKHGEAGTHGYIEGLNMRFGAGGADKLLSKLERVKLAISWTGEDYERLRKWLAGRARQLASDLQLFDEVNQG